MRLDPIAANCPNCSAAINPESIIAIAPVCTHCGTVLTRIGGSLGIVGAYGISDQSLTRARVDADLSVLNEHVTRLEGLIFDNKEKLNLPAKHYAKAVPAPQLTPTRQLPIDQLEEDLKGTVLFYEEIFLPGIFGFIVWYWAVAGILKYFLSQSAVEKYQFWVIAAHSLVFLPLLYHLSIFLMRCLVVIIKNGTIPNKNSKLIQKHKNEVAKASREAEPIKSAADHRLRQQIISAEGDIDIVKKKISDISRIRETL